MDPLSAAASVIALVQAGAGIAKVARVLRGFTKTQAEFCDFLNEIATLQGVFQDIESSLNHLPQLKAQLPIAASTNLSRIVAELLLAGSKGRGKDGLHRISKLQWQRSKAEISRLRDKTRSARESLSICFNALQVSQGIQATTTVLELRGLVETFSSTHEKKHAESLAVVEGQQTRLVDALSSTLGRKCESAIQQGNEDLKISIQQGNEDLIISMQRMMREMLQTHSRQRSPHLTTSHPETRPADSNSSWTNRLQSPTLSLQASLRGRCWSHCSCRCHKMSSIRSPKWLQPILGVFTFNYNCIPVLGPRSCNDDSCRAGPASFSLVYYFPKWAIARGIHVTTSWSSLTGAGAGLHLQVPVVIESGHEIWFYIKNNDVCSLRKCIARRDIPSSAVDNNGQSLILEALKEESWQACELLLTAGYMYNTALSSYEGATLFSVAMYQLRLRRYSERQPYGVPSYDEADSLLLRLAGIASHESIASTPLHNSILNLNTIPLHIAFAANPNAIDDWGETGLSPLMGAIETGDEAAVRFLISKGADLEKKDSFGATPLFQAVRRAGDGDAGFRIAQVLLEAGCDPNARTAGKPPLFNSTSHAMTKLLLDFGADPKLTTDFGWTVLHSLAPGLWLLDNHAEFPQLISALIASGADIIMLTTTRWNLHVHESDAYRVKCFHQQGARLDVIDNDQMTILHFASRYGQLEVIEYLRSVQLDGVDPDKGDKCGDTADDDLARVSDQTLEILILERRPTRAEMLSMKALLVETRERNWDQDLFLYSREDPVLWENHLAQKREVEELWKEFLDLYNSILLADGRDDKDQQGSNIKDGNGVTDGNQNNDRLIGKNSESLPSKEEEDFGSSDDSDTDESDSNDFNGSKDDFESSHPGVFQISIPYWLREEATSGNASVADEDSPGERGAVQSQEDSDDEDDVFFDAHQGEE